MAEDRRAEEHPLVKSLAQGSISNEVSGHTSDAPGPEERCVGIPGGLQRGTYTPSAPPDNARRDAGCLENSGTVQYFNGQYEGLHAVSLTHVYSPTLLLRTAKQEIILLEIGGHDEVYR